MSYASQQDLIDWGGIAGSTELKSLTDPANSTIDTLAVQKALQASDQIINARLVGVTLPLSSPYPPILVSTACAIARALLYKQGRPEHVQHDYDEALGFLDDVRAGKASLGLDATGAAEVPIEGTGAVVQANNTIFTEAQLAVL